MDLEQTFLQNLPLIERIIRFACRRHRWNADQAEEFAGTVRLKLIENDYGVFRGFRGRSSLSTYLTAVILRFALDHHRQIAGRWRASAQAESLGPGAVRLEALLYRDGRSLEDAVRTVRAESGNSPDEASLIVLAARIHARVTVREEPMDDLPHLPDPDPAADAVVRRAELGAAGARIAAALRTAVAALDAGDRLILRLRYREGFQVAEIARTLGGGQKSFYRRFERLQQSLRRALEESGLLAEENRELLDHPDLMSELEIFPPENGKERTAPSNVNGESRRRAPPSGAGTRQDGGVESPGGPHAG
jgi:RNA polymerase sigma factor (sigma-70 family)